MKQHVGAAIFDFDGVILDSANIKTEAFIEVFEDYPEHHQAIKNYHIEHQGITRFKKFEWIYTQLLGKSYGKAIKKKLGEEFSSIVFQKILNCATMPGAIEFLESLKNKIPCFIASGTPDNELEYIVKERDLNKYFEGIYGSNISKEEAIDRIAEIKSLEHSSLLFIGDATTDWKAAKSRGVPFIAVYSEEMDGFWQDKDIGYVENLMEIHGKLNLWDVN